MSTLSFTAASGGSIGLVGSDTASDITITVPAVNGILPTSTSTFGALNLMAGTTAQRPAAPLAGYLRFNTTLSVVEFYNGTIWVTL
jgi:hypothetical protein